MTLLCAVPAGAEPLLLSTRHLAERLTDPRLVLLHVGERAGYDKVHSPGARYADVRGDLHGSDGGLTLQMLPPALLRERLAALGVSNDSHIVVYHGEGGIALATRLILTLQHAGLTDVSLLDGGLAAWTREQRAVTADVPASRTGTLAPLAVKPIVADAGLVEAGASRYDRSVTKISRVEFPRP